MIINLYGGLANFVKVFKESSVLGKEDDVSRSIISAEVVILTELNFKLVLFAFLKFEFVSFYSTFV